MKQIVKWSDLELRKHSGEEKTKCPNCIDNRSNKRDKSFNVNHDKGIGHCHYCNAITVNENKKQSFQEVRYTLPPQEWSNYTSLSDGVVKYCAERKIRQETLIKFGVTEEKAYFAPQGKEMNGIVFNYFEGETVVNKKYRNALKDFAQSVGGKPLLYNINSAIGAKELWIVEGEFDVLALSEAGIDNAVSLSSGANDSDAQWKNSEPYLSTVEHFIIATDNDTKGIDVREKIAQRLGRYRCSYIEWENKDANDDLVGGVIENSVKRSKRFPIGGTFTVPEIMDSLMDLYRNGLPETVSPKKECFGNLPQIFTVMRGHLVVVTGIPSHGKSTFMEWYILNLVHEQNMKASFFSPEHRPMNLHLSNMARLAVGKSFFGKNRMSEQDVERFGQWASEKIYFTSPDGSDAADWDWILETFNHQMIGYGVDIFVVDAFNKVLLPRGANKKDEIDSVLTKLTAFAQANNIILVLVAHPTKMIKGADGKYEVPSLYDVSGSADFRNQAHDGLCVYRHFGDDGYNEVINLKTKYSFQGEIGAKAEFDYDLDTGRFFARGYARYDDDMTRPTEHQEPLPFDLLPNPEDAF